MWACCASPSSNVIWTTRSLKSDYPVPLSNNEINLLSKSWPTVKKKWLAIVRTAFHRLSVYSWNIILWFIPLLILPVLCTPWYRVFTEWRVPRYEVFAGLDFPVFNASVGKYGPKTTPDSDIFHVKFKSRKSAKLLGHLTMLEWYILELRKHLKSRVLQQ